MAPATKSLLEGNLNFRDVGGMQTADGQTVAMGLAYRSDHLAALTDDDRDRITELGIRTVCDYRGPAEKAESPSALPAAVEIVEVPITQDTAVQRLPLERLMSGELKAFTAADATAMYVDMLLSHATQFGNVLRRMADPAQRPLVFHCTAGKDRTGVTSALLLGLLGVDHETIVADYAHTNNLRSGPRLVELRPRLEAAGVDVDATMAFYTAPPEAMAATLRFLDLRFDGAEDYVRSMAGLGTEDIAALRQAFLGA